MQWHLYTINYEKIGVFFSRGDYRAGAFIILDILNS